MPRRARIQKRVILPDPLYTHEGVAKFMNVIMQRGKRSTAESIVYGAFDRIAKATKKDPVEVFESAIKNVTPVLEVKPRRIGGATYQGWPWRGAGSCVLPGPDRGNLCKTSWLAS